MKKPGGRSAAGLFVVSGAVIEAVPAFVGRWGVYFHFP
jgi:hypothetical protein